MGYSNKKEFNDHTLNIVIKTKSSRLKLRVSKRSVWRATNPLPYKASNMYLDWITQGEMKHLSKQICFDKLFKPQVESYLNLKLNLFHL